MFPASRYRATKDMLNVTAVDALGIRSFFLTLKLERASTRTDLSGLLPDSAKAMTKGLGPEAAKVLTDRLARMLRYSYVVMPHQSVASGGHFHRQQSVVLVLDHCVALADTRL